MPCEIQSEAVVDNLAIAHSIKPVFAASTSPESPPIQQIIDSLKLEPHIEGGYFYLFDVSSRLVPSPYSSEPVSEKTLALAGGLREGFDPATRLLSTSIYYYLSPNRPSGHFHSNRSRIVHTLVKGRGRYVLIHKDGRVESFIVGHNIHLGERVSWVVDGGAYKASFLLDDIDGSKESQGLLITETVVPGFEYADHEFLSAEKAKTLLGPDTFQEMDWLISKF